MKIPSWQMTVDRAEFAKALKSVGRTGKQVRSATAILTFDQSRLAVDLSGTVTQIPAAGEWPSEVRIAGENLERLARSLPEDDPLPLKVEGERLFVARFSISREWRLYSRPVSTPASQLLPANPDVFDVLMMAARCSREEIDTAGVAALVSKARVKLERLCTKAASFLGGYGVTPLHLKKLCEEHFTEGTRHFTEGEAKAIIQIAEVWALLAPMGVDPLEIKALMDNCLRNAWN